MDIFSLSYIYRLHIHTFFVINSYISFSYPGANHRSAQVLLLLVIPGHLIFLYTIHLMKSGHTSLTPIFMAVYLAAALLQVSQYNHIQKVHIDRCLSETKLCSKKLLFNTDGLKMVTYLFSSLQKQKEYREESAEKIV